MSTDYIQHTVMSTSSSTSEIWYEIWQLRIETADATFMPCPRPASSIQLFQIQDICHSSYSCCQIRLWLHLHYNYYHVREQESYCCNSYSCCHTAILLAHTLLLLLVLVLVVAIATIANCYHRAFIFIC